MSLLKLLLVRELSRVVEKKEGILSKKVRTDKQ